MVDLIFLILHFSIVLVIILFVIIILRQIRRDTVSHKPTSKIVENYETLPKLTFITGPLSGKSYDIKNDDLTIGRSKNATLCIDDIVISSMHLRIWKTNGSWFAEDLDSTNGTFVNGKRVFGIIELSFNDTIILGETKIIFRSGA